MAKPNQTLQTLNAETLSKFSNWIVSKRELAFFSVLVLSTKFRFKTTEYMMGRFGSPSMIVTNANEVFLGDEFLINITLKQSYYLILNSVLQIAHLHPHRLMPLCHPDTTPFTGIEIDIVQACVNTAAMLWVNNDLSKVNCLSYYDTMAGCEHTVATVTPENYWKALGWKKIEDVPPAISNFDQLMEGTVEGLAHLFVRWHNPDNPPRQPQPLWGNANLSEKRGKSDDALKSSAKMLVKKATQQALAERNKMGGSGSIFCPFDLDDLHMMDTKRLNYRHFLDQMIVDSYDDWQGYDRRDLNNEDYKYAVENETMRCIIYADTSGSLAGSIKDVIMEIMSIVRANSSKVLVKYFNDGVEEQIEEIWLTETTSVSDINIPTTSGGTSWSPIAEDIAQNHHTDNIIVITDGYFFDEIYAPANHSGKFLMVMSEDYNKDIDWHDYGMMVGYSDIPG